MPHEVRIRYKAPEFKCEEVQVYIFFPTDRGNVTRFTTENIVILFENLAKKEKEVEELKKIIYCYQETVKLFNKIMLKNKERL